MYTHKNGVTLRKIETSDLDKLQELKSESWFGTHQISIINREDQKRWFDNITSSKNDLMLVASFDGVDVGIYKVADIDWINRCYHSAHDVFKEQRGKKLGYLVLEAGIDFGFEVLNMRRIDTEVLSNNIASFKTTQYIGFVQEGIRRKAVHKCNEYIDSICLGILREDWFKLDRILAYKGICNISYQPKDDQ